MKDLRVILPLRAVPLYLACGRSTSKETVQALTRAFEQVRKDGTLKRITDRHAF